MEPGHGKCPVPDPKCESHHSIGPELWANLTTQVVMRTASRYTSLVESMGRGMMLPAHWRENTFVKLEEHESVTAFQLNFTARTSINLLFAIYQKPSGSYGVDII